MTMQLIGEVGSFVAAIASPILVILLAWVARSWTKMAHQLSVLSVRLKDQHHRLERLEDRFNNSPPSG
jgi:hypothetical protein